MTNRQASGDWKGSNPTTSSDGRVPPNDLDAEEAVLAAVLLKSTVLDTIQPILQSEQFYSDANRKIFEAFTDLSSKGRPVDILTTRGWLADRDLLQRAGGAAYLAQILNSVPAVSNADDYAKTVREKWRMRQIISECQRIAAEGYGTVDNVQQFIDMAEQSIYEIARTPESTTVEIVKEIIRATFTRMQSQEKTGIPTRFKRLDALTGGFHRGDLMIAAGRPGMGKTGWSLNAAVNVAMPPDPSESLAVAVFSLEMPKDQLAIRLLCSEARVDVSKVRTKILQREDWTKLSAAAGTLANAPIWIDDKSDLSVLELRAKVRRIQATSPVPLGLVVLDYIQLMSGNPKITSREQQISEISRNLKKLAKDLNVPVLALSQLNRAVETRGKNKRPQLSDLRESGAIEQDADGVMFIFRQDYYKDDPETLGLAELILAKQRNGPTGTVKVRFTKSCTRFDNLADEDYDEEEK